MFFLEAKIGILTFVLGAVGALTAQAAPTSFLAPDVIIQLLTTAVMVAIAYATLRTELKETRAAQKEQAQRLERIEETLNRATTNIAVLRSRLEREPRRHLNFEDEEET